MTLKLFRDLLSVALKIFTLPIIDTCQLLVFKKDRTQPLPNYSKANHWANLPYASLQPGFCPKLNTFGLIALLCLVKGKSIPPSPLPRNLSDLGLTAKGSLLSRTPKTYVHCPAIETMG